MKIKLLASTIEGNELTVKQHYTCFLIDETVAIDAGNLASATTPEQKQRIKDIVLTHAHLDHIAGLPLFIDDLFAQIREPVTIHAVKDVIDVLENDIFNWRVYPRFSELENEHGRVLTYREIEAGKPFSVGNLRFEAIPVNHKVPTVGYSISDGESRIAITGDTAEMDEFWRFVNGLDRLDALFIECAFPDRLRTLAEVSHHLTPGKLESELRKFERADCGVFVINLKPMYLKETVSEIASLGIQSLDVLKVGKEYRF